MHTTAWRLPGNQNARGGMHPHDRPRLMRQRTCATRFDFSYKFLQRAAHG
jgi:hypothetical protein